MNAQEAQRAFEIERGPFLVAAALLGLGGLIMFVAMALGTKAAVRHSRRFMETMDPSVGEFAKNKWGQLVAAGLAAGQAGAQAGADAWRKTGVSVDDIDWKTALFVGFCQCLAMIPGMSRSASTIMGARVLRVDRATSAEFSFFLAIPTMLGASVYDTYKNWKTLDWNGGGLIAIGFVVAFLSALVVVKPFVRFISRHGFGVFAWYRIAVGKLALVLLLMH